MKQLRKLDPKLIEDVRKGHFEEEVRTTLFSDADLTAVDLSGCNLSNFNFSGSQLFKANFENTELYGADLSKADCTGANFNGANLSESKMVQTGLGHSLLIRANLFNADIRESTFTGANLTESDFRSANLCGARLRDTILRGADFTATDLSDTDLTNASVISSEFKESNLQNAVLCNLEGFRDANWIGADVRLVNFSGAYRIRREIMDQNYLDEFRKQGKLHEVIYQIWWFTSDCGRSMIRWGGLTLFQMLFFALIYKFVAVDYGDYPTGISNIYHSVVTMTTLGYGDTLPMSITAQVVVMIQVVLSYVMLGGFMALLTNKLARRAE